MDPNQPFVVVEGMEEIIQRDLEKHKVLLERTEQELRSYRLARSHEIKKKRHYLSLIGDGKFDDEALQNAIDTQINVNIRHLTDKCKTAEEKIEHHKMIVDHLTKQLEQQMQGLKYLAAARRANGGNSR
jgi:hypothetical protein